MNRKKLIFRIIITGFLLLLTWAGYLLIRPVMEKNYPCGVFSSDNGVFLYSEKGLQGDRLFFIVGDDIPSNFEAKSILECPNGDYHVELRDNTNRPGGWDCSTDLPIDWRNQGGKAVSIKVEKHDKIKTDCPKYP